MTKLGSWHVSQFLKRVTAKPHSSGLPITVNIWKLWIKGNSKYSSVIKVIFLHCLTKFNSSWSVKRLNTQLSVQTSEVLLILDCDYLECQVVHSETHSWGGGLMIEYWNSVIINSVSNCTNWQNKICFTVPSKCQDTWIHKFKKHFGVKSYT